MSPTALTLLYFLQCEWHQFFGFPGFEHEQSFGQEHINGILTI